MPCRLSLAELPLGYLKRSHVLLQNNIPLFGASWGLFLTASPELYLHDWARCTAGCSDVWHSVGGSYRLLVDAQLPEGKFRFFIYRNGCRHVVSSFFLLLNQFHY